MQATAAAQSGQQTRRLLAGEEEPGILRAGARCVNRARRDLCCERRFAAVATNLSTGRELWFTEGDLHLAIRASCSMPGLMSPVRHNGYWYTPSR
ncbi:patatin-like phospholipase family protein [Acinetobacter pittii]|uniref:patatin-like phospholipase family protein n=1 Tax=Acinetobacter pittii TaxID=48296 RepID=UPI003AF3170F